MSEISTLSLVQCETLLRELRSFRTATKKIGARAQNIAQPESVRVELCPHTSAESVVPTLTKLGITPSDVVYSINPKIQ